MSSEANHESLLSEPRASQLVTVAEANPQLFDDVLSKTIVTLPSSLHLSSEYAGANLNLVKDALILFYTALSVHPLYGGEALHPTGRRDREEIDQGEDATNPEELARRATSLKMLARAKLTGTLSRIQNLYRHDYLMDKFYWKDTAEATSAFAERLSLLAAPANELATSKLQDWADSVNFDQRASQLKAHLDNWKSQGHLLMAPLLRELVAEAARLQSIHAHAANLPDDSSVADTGAEDQQIGDRILDIMRYAGSALESASEESEAPESGSILPSLMAFFSTLDQITTDVDHTTTRLLDAAVQGFISWIRAPSRGGTDEDVEAGESI